MFICVRVYVPSAILFFVFDAEVSVSQVIMYTLLTSYFFQCVSVLRILFSFKLNFSIKAYRF